MSGDNDAGPFQETAQAHAADISGLESALASQPKPAENPDTIKDATPSVSHWSLRLDLAILLRTPIEVLRGSR